MPDMPFVGVGLHVVIALFFAIHAVRKGHPIYWLIILFVFPLLGSIVYFVAVYLPDTRIQQNLHKTASAVVRNLDPGRELREARQAFDLTASTQNQMRLADALLDAGVISEALEHYQYCLKGPHANDPQVCVNAAKALLLDHQAGAAIKLLTLVRDQNANYHPEQVSLLLAQTYGALGKAQQAREEFAAAVARFGSTEARAEYAIWALSEGDINTATTLDNEIKSSMKYWNKHARALNKPILAKLKAAFAAVGR